MVGINREARLKNPVVKYAIGDCRSGGSSQLVSVKAARRRWDKRGSRAADARSSGVGAFHPVWGGAGARWFGVVTMLSRERV